MRYQHKGCHSQGKAGEGACLNQIDGKQWTQLSLLILHFNFFLGGEGGSGHGKPAEASSPEGTREISQNQASELSSAAIVPQGDVVADITRSEDKLNLIPGNAAGTATTQRHPSVLLEHKKNL